MTQRPSHDDDGYDIEVAAAPPRRRRASNPEVDEAIQSGEIILPRSSIIRSQSQPVAEESRSDLPAVADAPPPEAPPRLRPTVPSRRLRFTWLVLALVPCAVLVALSFIKPSVTAAAPVHTIEADSTAQLLASTLDGEARAALVRAEAIASTPMLRAGIQTDAKTLSDMANDKDIVFSHAAGETIEVFQGGSDSRVSMLRLPNTAPPIAPPPAGTTRLEQRGDQLVVIADAAVTSSETHAVGGEVALTVPIDLTAIRKRPYEQLTGITLSGLGAPIALGTTAAAPGGVAITSTVVTTIAKGPALTVGGTLPVAPPVIESQAPLMGARIACIGLAFILLVAFGISLRR